MYIVDELAERLNAKKIVEIKAVIVEGVDLDELKELCKTTDTKILVELLQLCNASMGQVFAENTYYEYQDKKEIK